MKRSHRYLLVALLGLGLAGCATEPASPAARDDLRDDAQATLNKFYRRDPTLDNVLRHIAGYAVFPTVGKGGFIGGGAYGRGLVYRHGRPAGFADITEASVGLQAGGESFSELIIFQTPEALQKFEDNELSFEANASAVALRAGAAANVNFHNGVAVFMTRQSGLMAEAAIGGQRFRFEPMNGAAGVNDESRMQTNTRYDSRYDAQQNGRTTTETETSTYSSPRQQ